MDSVEPIWLEERMELLSMKLFGATMVKLFLSKKIGSGSVKFFK